MSYLSISKTEYLLLKDSRQKLDESMDQVQSLIAERKKYSDMAGDLKKRLKSDNAAAVETLEILSSTLIKNDSHYSKKVAVLAKAIGEEFELELSKIKIIEVLSRLHLTGLMFVDNKGDELKFCPEKSLFLLEKFSELKKISSVFKDLDEFFDGSGPNSKKGKNVCLEIRIVRAAAFYYNFYFKNYSINQIIEKLDYFSGKNLDPDSVSVLFKVLQRKDLFSDLQIKAVNVHKLKPGMVLKSGIFSKRGAMLLPSGTRLDKKNIEKIISFDLSESVTDTILVINK
jgi:response regulator RpfG family c-di-GMP phosphodiesterase